MYIMIILRTVRLSQCGGQSGQPHLLGEITGFRTVLPVCLLWLYVIDYIHVYNDYFEDC